MKTEFRKVSERPTTFEMKEGSFVSSGMFQKVSHKLVKLQFRLSGTPELVCDRCGTTYWEKMEEEITLNISDGSFEGDDLDIIECYDHIIDFDAIVVGEIEAFKSDYHYCENCKENEGE